jgi:hypothetical protein
MTAGTIVVDTAVHPYDLASPNEVLARALEIPGPWSALRAAAHLLPA